jgi:hypothetical protein
MKFTFSFLSVLCSVLLQAQLNIQQLGHFTFPQNVSTSNLTGYADTLGREYALVGTSVGLSIVDITTPATPVQLFMVPPVLPGKEHFGAKCVNIRAMPM